MSEYSQKRYDSPVDLTEDEDEDSRDSVVGSEIRSRKSDVQNIPLPPLTPIPKFSSTASTVNNNAPTLTKIQAQHRVFRNNPAIAETAYSSPTRHVPSTSTGKTVVIKKNGKLYRIVIPTNVIPTCDKGGPVVINIPEVGPLVIKLDPQVKNQPTTKLPPALEPFSLNFDDIIDKASTAEIMADQIVASRECTPTEKVFSTSEKVLCCWTSLFSRTRTKLSSFHGFSKREQALTKRCHNHIISVITKQKRLLEIAKDKKRNNNNITSLRGSQKNSSMEDLLVTKKIVVLNDKTGEELHTTKRGKKRRVFTQRRRKSVYKKPDLQLTTMVKENQFNHLIKPCYVTMERNKVLDYIYKNGNLTIDFKNNSSPMLQSLWLDTPKKLPDQNEMNISKQDMHKTKSLYLSKVINDIRTFTAKMAFIKPVLVINEFNFSIVRFPTEFSRSNIVYSVAKDRKFPEPILTSGFFAEAVGKEYVLLIDCDILCEYFKGIIGPPSLKPF